MTRSKPKKGSVCNGCGLCCIEETCAVGIEAFGNSHQICPALYWVNDKFRCGLMDKPFDYIEPESDGDYLSRRIHQFGQEVSAEYYQYLIGADTGCDSED